MPRNLTIFGIPNHVALPHSSFTVSPTPGIVPVGFEPEYLKNEEPSDTARLLSLDPKDSQWIWRLGTPSRIAGLALVNHNLYRGSQIRFVAPVGSSRYLPVTLAPNSTPGASNITGNHANVDETISAPDGLNITPTITSTAWEARFGFATPSPAPLLGSSLNQLASVVIRARRVIVAGTENTSPKLTVDLYENGIGFKKTLGYRAVSSSNVGGQIFIFPFDFSELTGTNGINLEIKVSCTPGSGTAGLSSYCVLEVLNIYYDDGTFTFDSGYITVETEDTVSSNLTEPTKSNHYIPVVPWNLTGVNGTNGAIVIRSDQSQHDVPLNDVNGAPITISIANMLEFIEAGVAPIGDGLSLEIGMSQENGPSYGVSIQDLGSGYTLGGQSYGASSWRRRYTPPLTLTVNRSELKTLQQIAWTRGHSGAMYIALEPDLDPGWQKFSAFWGTIKSIGEPRELNFAPDGTATYTISIEFEEKL